MKHQMSDCVDHTKAQEKLFAVRYNVLDYRASNLTFYLLEGKKMTKDYEIKIFDSYFSSVDRMLTLQTYTDLNFKNFYVIYWIMIQFLIFIIFFLRPLYMIIFMDTQSA